VTTTRENEDEKKMQIQKIKRKIEAREKRENGKEEK